MIKYTPDFVPNKIMIIGCGGTGSRLVPLLAQFIRTCKWVLNPEITLIDDDIVEEKNLSRQNFIAPDVGKPKAVVLANRYSRAFDINIVPLVTRIGIKKNTTGVSASRDYVTSETTFTNISDEDHRAAYARYSGHCNNAIVILCVDSPEARRDILSSLVMEVGYHGQNSKVLLIDAGNENDFGQVKIGHLTHTTYSTSDVADLPMQLPGDMPIPCIPLDKEYFNSMTAVPNSASCADLDQTMAINTAMATTMFGVIQNLYYAKPIAYHRIDVSLSYGSIPQLINRAWLQKIREQANTMTNADVYVGGHRLPAVSIGLNFRTFYKDVYAPIKAAMDRAEAEAALEAVAKANAEKKIKSVKKPTSPKAAEAQAVRKRIAAKVAA